MDKRSRGLPRGIAVVFKLILFPVRLMLSFFNALFGFIANTMLIKIPLFLVSGFCGLAVILSIVQMFGWGSDRGFSPEWIATMLIFFGLMWLTNPINGGIVKFADVISKLLDKTISGIKSL
jgi:hypothetical protein